MMMNSCLSRTSGRSVRRLWWSPYQSGCPCARTSWWPASPEYCCSPTRDTCCPSTYKHTRLTSLLARGSWVFLLWKVSDVPGFEEVQGFRELVVEDEVEGHGALLYRRTQVHLRRPEHTNTHTFYSDTRTSWLWGMIWCDTHTGMRSKASSKQSWNRQRTQTPQKYNTRHTRELLSALRSHDRLYF